MISYFIHIFKIQDLTLIIKGEKKIKKSIININVSLIIRLKNLYEK